MKELSTTSLPGDHHNMDISGESALPALPDSSCASDSQSLTVNGSSVALSALGPIIINSDGTTSRINNWETLSEGERTTALKLIAKRNKERREKLLDDQ